jgi:hypothetical protein
VTYIVYDINIDSGSRRTVWRKLVHISFGLKINYDVDPDPLGTVPATLLDFWLFETVDVDDIFIANRR